MESDRNCGDMFDDTKLKSRSIASGSRSEFVTSIENTMSSTPASTLNSATPSSPMFVSARIQQKTRARSQCATEIESEVEASKDHWSQLESNDTTDIVAESNLEVFKSLQEERGGFFYDYGDRLKVGRKIAAGGQAEIFEAHVEHLDGNKVDYALKVFKEGYSLRNLQKQWPHDLLQRIDGGGIFTSKDFSVLYDGTLMPNGRFAFRIQRCWGDLRRLIDVKMQLTHNQCMPFTDEEVDCIMFDITGAMRDLHKFNTLHRDLKASNILILPYWEIGELLNFNPLMHKFRCAVSDYECSLGVSGTGFWRAPEILLAQKNHAVKSQIFTEKSDTFSFGMTCYEILTGWVPFEDIGMSDYDHVLCGERPELPEAVKPALKELVTKCWH